MKSPGRRALRATLERTHTRWAPDSPKPGDTRPLRRDLRAMAHKARPFRWHPGGQYMPNMINPVGGQMMRIDRTLDEKRQIVAREIGDVEMAAKGLRLR